ncbi:hypothetical protein DAMA08_052570 [Martiniozyma asiatica (nom. inval.)]|nr:hypothetical protein DAMA08_052570 [Martiniozyma asiatica]
MAKPAKFIIRYNRFISKIRHEKFKDKNKTNVNKKSILNLLSPQSNNEPNELENRVSSIELLNMNHHRELHLHIQKLSYILHHMGINNENKMNSNSNLVNKLIDIPTCKIKQLAREDNFGNQMVILAHLIFLGELDVDTFMRLVMKLQINELVEVHRRLYLDAKSLFNDWDKDERTNIMVSVVLAARYEMLNDIESATTLVEFSKEDWFSKLSKLRFSDIKNIFLLCNKLIDKDWIKEIILNYEDDNVKYIAWEIWGDVDIRESIKMEGIKGLLIRLESESILVDSKWKGRFLSLSRRLGISLKDNDKLEKIKSKLLVMIELTIEEINDSIQGSDDEAQIRAGTNLRHILHEFKNPRPDSQINLGTRAQADDEAVLRLLRNN